MLRQCIFVASALLNLELALAKFSWTNCSPANSPIHIETVEISPDPIVVPGDLSFKFVGHTTAPFASSSIAIDMYRIDENGEESHFPCILHIGSCTYDDSCTILETLIEEDYAGVTGDIGRQVKAMMLDAGIDPAACPQPAQDISLQSTLALPAIPALLAALNFVDGDYHAKLSITDNASGDELLCIDAYVSLEQDCHGLACIFGKK